MQFFIVLSCLISVSVNFSTFLVIGKTSPVTYQVLGHLKTCLVLTFGYVLLHDPFSWRNILGILIAVVGMVLYSYFCTVETQQKNAEVSPQQVPFLCAGEISVCAFNFCCPSELDTLPHLSNRERCMNLAVNTEFDCLVRQVFPFHFLYIFNTTEMEQTKAVLSLSCKNGIIDLLSNFNMYWHHARNHFFLSCL